MAELPLPHTSVKSPHHALLADIHQHSSPELNVHSHPMDTSLLVDTSTENTALLVDIGQPDDSKTPLLVDNTVAENTGLLVDISQPEDNKIPLLVDSTAAEEAAVRDSSRPGSATMQLTSPVHTEREEPAVATIISLDEDKKHEKEEEKEEEEEEKEEEEEEVEVDEDDSSQLFREKSTGTKKPARPPPPRPTTRPTPRNVKPSPPLAAKPAPTSSEDTTPSASRETTPIIVHQSIPTFKVGQV